LAYFCPQNHCILLTEICFWVMVVQNFAPKKTLVRNQQISKRCHTSLLVAILQRRKKPDSGVG
jgi:hypothetical protein